MAYKMTHPAEPKTEIEVRAEYVEMYESQGWERKATSKAPQSEADSK